MFTPTLEDISAWGGPLLLKEAEGLLKRNDVRSPRFEDGVAHAKVVFGGGLIDTGFRISRSSTRIIESECRCPANRKDGRICAHVVALGLLLYFREHDPELRRRLENEERHARALAEAEASGGIIARAGLDEGGIPADIRVRLPRDWRKLFWDPSRPLRVQCLASIAGAPAIPLDKIGRGLRLCLTRGGENLLCFLEEVCEGRPGDHVDLTPADFIDLLALHHANGLKLYRSGGVPMTVRAEKVDVRVAVDMDRENGELILSAHPEIPGGGEIVGADIVAAGRLGYVAHGNDFWPIRTLLPTSYLRLYDEPAIVPRNDLVRFLRTEAPKFRDLCTLTEEISLGLFETLPAKPTFSVRLKGSPASVVATLHAVYGKGAYDLVAGADSTNGDFAIPDPDNLFRYRTRDPKAEAAALQRINRMGFAGANGGALAPVVGLREVLNILGGRVPEMQRLGWKIDYEGSIRDFANAAKRAVPSVRIESFSHEEGRPGLGLDWFEVGFEISTPSGTSLTPAEVQRAIQMGESFVRRGNDVVLLDTAGVEAMRGAFRSCHASDGSRPGTFRMRGVHAAYVASSLASAAGGIRVDASPDWRAAAARQNRSGKPESISLGEPLDGILRPYQKEGVAWLRFLEESRSGGILADEMGLGKTLQTLAWLQMERADPAERGLPALIVAPTSLVSNWEHEALRFTPSLRPLVLSGGERHALWDDIPSAPLVVTSYALLRRDIDRHAAIRYACVVLDEAQNIKNRATQNAQAVKNLQASHRLVLTGTPVENGPADLWSIMDFLMPGYLGAYEEFKTEFEAPLSLVGEPECDDARARLRRKLRPFLLRRRKTEVARDLPEKIVQVSYCPLSDDQKTVYRVLLERTRSTVRGMVAADGFAKSRMKVLAELLRLRQVCCHLRLLRSDPALLAVAERAEAPSAKTEQFMEILDEAVSGGHRILVFSQFTTMLGLLRERLQAEGVRHCYLDGETRDRLVVCQTFNSDPSIPVFLISLKAGGTGLNLTGADTVVHFDPWWNPAAEDQATDRAHRIGQKRTVNCLKLIAEGTIEEKVLELQQRKRALIGATVEGGASASMDEISWEDVRGLLDLPE